MDTAKFVTVPWHIGNNAAALVEYVRLATADFETRKPRGYAATACLFVSGYDGGPEILAFNDIPFCVEDAYSMTPRGVERAPKFAALGHAEINAIAFAAKNGVKTEGGMMILAWFPCINCAAAIAKTGIKKLIATIPNYDYKPDQYDFRGAEKTLRDAGVEIVFEKTK